VLKFVVFALVHFAFARRSRSNSDIASSLDFSETVFKAVRNHATCRLVNISTVGDYAASEDYMDEDALIGPDTIYGMAKYASEVLMRSIFEGVLDRTTNLRLGGVAQSQRILPVFIENACRKHQMNITGGTQQFSWIDTDDANTAIAAALKMDKWQPTYNITLDKKRYLITDIAKMVASQAEKLGYGNVEICLTPQDIHLCVGWTSKRFIDDSGWTPEVSLEKTIEKMF
jgi:nucleoside-diphosphate-sugar epimerase